MAFMMASSRPTTPLLLALLLLFVLVALGDSSETPLSCPAGDDSCADVASARSSTSDSLGSVTGRSNPSLEAIEALLVEKQRLSSMLERSISRVRQLEAVLASPSCPCSAGGTSFALPLPGAANVAAADTGIIGEYTGADQHTLVREAEVARLAALEKERVEAEIKRVQAAKLLARATCNPLPLSPPIQPLPAPLALINNRRSLRTDTRRSHPIPHQYLPPASW